MNKKSNNNKKDKGVVFNINREIEKLNRIIQEDNLDEFDIKSHREDLENLKEDTVKRFARANRYANLVLIFTMLLIITIVGLIYFLEEFREQNFMLSFNNNSIANTILGKKDGEFSYYTKGNKIVTYEGLKQEKDSLLKLTKAQSIYLKLAKDNYSINFSEKLNIKDSLITYSIKAPKLDSALILLKQYKHKILKYDADKGIWTFDTSCP